MQQGSHSKVYLIVKHDPTLFRSYTVLQELLLGHWDVFNEADLIQLLFELSQKKMLREWLMKDTRV